MAAHMSDVEKVVQDLRNLAKLYRATELNEAARKGGPTNQHCDGFVEGENTYSVGVILDGVAESLRRKYLG